MTALSSPPAGPAAAPAGQGMRLAHAIMAVAVLVVLVAGAIFFTHATAARRAQERQASHTVAGLASLLAEQAGRIFDVASLLGTRARTIAAGRDWSELERNVDAHRALARLIADFGYISAAWLIDADGVPRLGTRAFPAPRVNLADQEYFRVHREDRRTGLHVSPVAPSRFSEEPVLIVSQRIEDGKGALRGVVMVVLDPKHLLRLYDSIRVEYPVTVDLARDDGALLIRSTAPGRSGLDRTVERVGRPPPAERFNIGVGPAVDPTTGTATIQGLKRVRGFPVYAAVSVTEADITARWLGAIGFHAMLAILALLAVVAALAALRHFSRREAHALHELHRENAILEERVVERSLAIERMITEVKHRVKNSLQLAASLMHLQRGRQAEDGVREPLALAHARILAIGRVHRQLQQAREFYSIDLQDYLTSLAHDIAVTVAPLAQPPRIVSDIQAVAVRLDLAMPLALIVTELVSNAVKHAPRGCAANIAVSLAIDRDMAKLSVEDRGGGFPPAFDPNQSAGLGMSVLRGLTRQIDGRLVLDNTAAGVRVAVIFPLRVVTDGARAPAGSD